MRLVLIDNYDSFTWNLAHLVAQVIGELPAVYANDAVTFDDLEREDPVAILLSPGPGHPARARDFGICQEILRSSQKPVLGICLGHQGIALEAGIEIRPADRIVHGLTSRITHCGHGLFTGIPQDFEAVRYHSWIVPAPLEQDSDLQCLAWTADQGYPPEVMAVRRRSRPHWGVQFHPESICTEHGALLLRNFLSEARVA
jgi:para-aminobenzoate synthetase